MSELLFKILLYVYVPLLVISAICFWICVHKWVKANGLI